MVHANPPVTGRTTVFFTVEVFDHEREAWAPFSLQDSAAEVDADTIIQGAVDAGHDDARFVLHLSGGLPIIPE